MAKEEETSESSAVISASNHIRNANLMVYPRLRRENESKEPKRY